ncbi:hypothetical protein EJ110_NYTH57967 [Nymphaea thermarum]|nr:hypothetical protein EJ110_NYTH57967 [Nymphaea thermarum]
MANKDKVTSKDVMAVVEAHRQHIEETMELMTQRLYTVECKNQEAEVRMQVFMADQQAPTAMMKDMLSQGDEVPQLMRVEGLLRGRRVSILVDTGSSHNFISKKSAKTLGCRVEQQQAFDVVVGNGSTLKCKGRCFQETLDIQGHKFLVELFTLAMAGA